MKIIALIPQSGNNKYGLRPTLSFPDSSIVKNGNPVFIPDFDTSFSGRLFLAVKISRLGKNVAERFACRYYSEIAPAIAVVADNLLDSLRQEGLPWTIATGFDKSLVLGNFIPAPENEDVALLMTESSGKEFKLPIPVRKEIEKGVCEVSRYNSLKMGDLILIPFQTDPFPLEIDSQIQIKKGDEILLKLPVR